MVHGPIEVCRSAIFMVREAMTTSSGIEGLGSGGMTEKLVWRSASEGT